MFPRASGLGVLILGLTLLLLSGCASSSGPDTSASALMRRIDANRDAYETWPDEVKVAILEGRVENGMTPEMVRVVLGNPAEITARNGRGGVDEEVWIYRTGGGGGGFSGLGGAGISIGGGPVVVSSSTSGGGYSDPGEEHEIVFRDGRVVSADLPTKK